MAKILIVYYSMYGSTYELAKSIEVGAKAAGAEVRIRQVPDHIPESVWKNMKGVPEAKALQASVPVATNDDMMWADGIIFGSPTRFGNMAGQMKNFLDQTGGLWFKGALDGKVAAFFTGAATIHGGHETTILTMSTYAYHHGMTIVTNGYTLPESGSTTSGGGPYGPSHYGQQGKRSGLDNDEKTIAENIGKRVAMTAKKLFG
jgi:NAD(P)H dehydrogenase (quinone)